MDIYNPIHLLGLVDIVFVEVNKKRPYDRQGVGPSSGMVIVSGPSVASSTSALVYLYFHYPKAKPSLPPSSDPPGSYSIHYCFSSPPKSPSA